MSTFRMRIAASAMVLTANVASAVASPEGPVTNIVLVHGAFADGSGWERVADILRKDGYKVSVAQPPMTSLEDDVSATRRILDRQDGRVVLVGHSYAGGIITQAGNDPRVAALVYVAALVPDEGEVLGALLQSKPGASAGVSPTSDGFLFLDPKVFGVDFAGDVPKAKADFMALSQMPVAAKAFGTPITTAAWKVKPSYAIVATQDRIINPDLERSMYERAHAHVTEINGSHAIFISQPRAVANVIERAAREAK
jgi:pimeloyl-ACP methyl ester carboxylesterase